jgi:hypothetical protein
MNDPRTSGSNRAKTEPNAKGYTYFVRDGDSIKIGSSMRPKERISSMQTSHFRVLETLAVVPMEVADEYETHQRFEHLRVRGEWFRAAPELLQFIIDLGGKSEQPSIAEGLTLASLIEQYKADRVSGWSKLRFHTRQNHESVLRRILAAHGDRAMASIRRRDLELWHLDWSAEGAKAAMGHMFMSKIRTVCGYGASMLEDPDCNRICMILSGRKFEMGTPDRSCFMTAAHAIAIRKKAHEIGYASMALAQAIQFELVLRQRDCLGEWVPIGEPGESDVTWNGEKWLRGIRWSEIDEDLILRHTTSKKQKPIEVDLKLAPMVMEELALWPQYMRSPTGPLIISEATARPWKAVEFRRKWRIFADLAGVPKEVKNMHSRHGGISEGTDAGVPIEHMSKAATHSDIAMTRRYDRNDTKKIAEAMRQRAAYRAAQSQH